MDPATLAGLLQGGGAIASIFGGRNSGKKDLNRLAGYGQQAYNPFIQQGQQAQQQLSPQYSQMAGNPTDFYNQILQQYQPSAGYQHQAGKLNQLAHNKAAAGGYAGTAGDIFEHGEGLQGLMGQDMQQFLQNILGIQGAGQQGLEGQVGRGFQASGSLADYLGGASQLQARNKMFNNYIGNENRMSGLSALSGLIGTQQNQGSLYKPLNKLFGGG